MYCMITNNLCLPAVVVLAIAVTVDVDVMKLTLTTTTTSTLLWAQQELILVLQILIHSMQIHKRTYKCLYLYVCE